MTHDFGIVASSYFNRKIWCIGFHLLKRRMVFVKVLQLKNIIDNLSLKEVAWKVKEKFELVNTDVCGPMQTSLNSLNMYFILFIDD
jgi:hypothetical protein